MRLRIKKGDTRLVTDLGDYRLLFYYLIIFPSLFCSFSYDPYGTRSTFSCMFVAGFCLQTYLRLLHIFSSAAPVSKTKQISAVNTCDNYESS